jgi:hypothetical protein
MLILAVDDDGVRQASLLLDSKQDKYRPEAQDK